MSLLSKAKRYAWAALIIAIALYIASGAVFATDARPRSVVDRIGLAVTFLSGATFLMAIVLSALHVAPPRDRHARSGLLRRALPLVGPVIVFIGMELVPHAANPCTISQAMGRANMPAVCEVSTYRSGFGGKGEVTTSVDLTGRWHGLAHAVIGGVPMMLGYWLALKKWRPDVLGVESDPILRRQSQAL